MAIHMRGLCPLIQVFDMDNSLHFYCELLGFVGTWDRRDVHCHFSPISTASDADLKRKVPFDFAQGRL